MDMNNNKKGTNKYGRRFHTYSEATLKIVNMSVNVLTRTTHFSLESFLDSMMHERLCFSCVEELCMIYELSEQE